MATVNLIDLSKRFGKELILNGVDLELDEGELLVLLGPSGCGKSTILNIIAGLLAPTCGDVHIGGRSVLRLHPKDRDVSMVFQSYALYPNLSVARNIGFGLEMRGVARAERESAIASVAKRLKISELLTRRPAELSGGQRQRVAIGRALVRNPAVFLFDEPLSNLDAKLRMETRTEIKRLHHSLGKTMIYVTHDQIEAMTLATRIAILREGRIEQFDTPEAVYRRPASLFVAGFVGSPGMNLLAGRIHNGRFLLDDEQGNVAIPQIPEATGERAGVTLGIRPENLHLTDASDSQGFAGQVDVVELTGPEKIAVVSMGNAQVLACLPPDTNIQPGEQCKLVFSVDSAVLFDTESGQRL